MKEITGRHVLIGTVSAFGIIIAANMTLAVNAVRTFPGLEVKNSYVASQNFDREKAAQQALGWSVAARIDGERLVVSITDLAGSPVRVADIGGTFGMATHVKEDQTPGFRFEDGVYVADVAAHSGNWNLRLSATAADGTAFRQRIPIYVR
jgi:nitrogen fixation protein FixH